jgi:ABC-2 type transport system permease protein
VAYFGGWKVVVIFLWLPLAAFLSWIFKPTFDITDGSVSLLLLPFGVRISFVPFCFPAGYDYLLDNARQCHLRIVFWLELILSGRLVPMTLLPPWVQSLSNYLPFKWTFFLSD